MDWQGLFQNHILGRGLQYYKQGLVEDFYKDKDSVQATVQGSEAYTVQIEMENGEPIDMYCDCPYADKGNYCKHMAAVFYYMEKEDRDGIYGEKVEAGLEIRPKVGAGEEKKVKELVETADEKVIRNFLTDVLENDEKLLNRFRSVLGCEISTLDMKRFKTQINGVFRKYAGRHGFVDYYNADSFIAELEDFLDHDAWGMVENRQLEEAFELTNYIFVKTGNQDMDDSAGGTGMLADRCVEIWQAILEVCDIGLKRKMFRWYTKQLDGSVIDYMKDYIEQILFEDFLEDEFLVYKLKFTDEKISSYKKEKDSWRRSYYCGEWVLKHIGVMKDRKMTEEQIDQYYQENLDFSGVRKYYIDSLIKNCKYDAAIRVLEEGKVIDKDFPEIVADYSLKLKDLYQQTRNQQAYEQELWSFVLEYRAGDVTAFKELKSLYAEEEWKAKREIIFKSLPSYAAVDKLYEVEKLYDRLLKIVLDSRDLYKLKEYEKSLKKIYSVELLDKYEKEVRNMARHTSDRRCYQEIVAVLKRMLEYPEGVKKVKEIVADFRQTYNNRPAMMDELRKI